MNAHLNEQHIHAMLTACANAQDEDARGRLARELVTHLWDTEVLMAWSINLMNRYSGAAEAEELRQVIAEGIMKRAMRIDASEVAAVVKPSAHLFFVAKRSAEAFCDSGAVTLAGHMTGVSRRYRRAQKARQDYVREHGEDPTARELVEWANARSHETVADPVKAGVLITIADVQGVGVRGHSLDDDALSDAARPSTSDNAESMAAVALTANQIVAVVRELHSDPQEAAEVARFVDAWIGLVAAGQSPTIQALSKELGGSRVQAQRANDQIMAVLEAFRERHS